VIDAHAHVFREASDRYPRDVSPLFPADRAAPVEELLASMERHGVAGAVLVALSRHDEYVTECLRRYPGTFRGILVQDPARPDPPDVVKRRIEAAGAQGLRVFDLRVELELLEWLATEDLKLWAYLQADELERLGAVLEGLPELPVVLNHLAFPYPAPSPIPPATWPAASRLARFGNVHVMFSGQYAFSRSPYPYPDLIEYARMVYRRFGAARMMWASDYPWPAVDPGYGRLLELVERTFPDLTAEERADVLGGTCARLFGL
jgi:predicted TIM-barrel fold metal-dependent hydrolase